jgi:hypothetical protein
LTRKRQIWVTSLKALLAVNVIWQVANIVMAVVRINQGEGLKDLNQQGFFLVMRVSGDLATICFLITGIVIRAKVNALPRQTAYEQQLAAKH